VATPTEPSDLRATKTSATVKTVAHALWVAGTAFVVTASLEVAFVWNLQTNDCARGGSPLFLGSPVVLLLGGIISLSLVLIQRSQGSPRRRWAIGAAVLEMALSLILVAFNLLAQGLHDFGCEPLTFPGG
jgi:hypothetical protein